MATEKNISSRIIHKHDIEANWNKANNFIPKAGEIIVYDKDETYDYERFKIGDGETVVVNLPFAIVQPDWNQNDESSPDYIKNRTHYYQENSEIILEEQTIDFTSSSYYELNSSVIPGETYIINWDGVKYQLVAYSDEIVPGEIYVPKIMPDDNAFVITGSDLSTNNKTIHTVSVVKINSILKTLDDIYIPNTIARAADIVGLSVGNHSEIFNDLQYNKAEGAYAHAEGYQTAARGDYAHAEGEYSWASGKASHAENHSKASGNYSHTEGYGSTAYGSGSHAEGQQTKAYGDYSHAEGSFTTTIGEYSHAEGYETSAYGNKSHAEGYGTISYGEGAHAEGSVSFDKIYITGDANTTTYTYSPLGAIPPLIKIGDFVVTSDNIYAIIADFDSTTDTITLNKTLSATAIDNKIVSIYGGVASGEKSHAEGYGSNAYGSGSHAEGDRTVAYGNYSHAEGKQTNARGNYSHAEGYETEASGEHSHVEGWNTMASGSTSHAEGRNTVASGDYSHAEGYLTIAASEYQHVQGKCNIEDANTYAHIVGNGYAAARSNAHTLDWDGNAWFAGDIYIGSTSGTNKDEGSKKLITLEDVQSLLPKSTIVSIPAANWTGDAVPYSQVISVNEVTANSKVDLQPSAIQIVEMQNDDIALMTENNDGVITVYALGSKPTVNYTMQALITEVIPV